MKIKTNPTATPERITYIFIVVDDGAAGTGITDSVVILVEVAGMVEVMDASATMVDALAVVLNEERRCGCNVGCEEGRRAGCRLGWTDGRRKGCAEGRRTGCLLGWTDGRRIG